MSDNAQGSAQLCMPVEAGQSADTANKASGLIEEATTAITVVSGTAELAASKMRVRIVFWIESDTTPDATYIYAEVGKKLALWKERWVVERVPAITARVHHWCFRDGEWCTTKLQYLELLVVDTAPTFLLRCDNTTHCLTLGRELALAELAISDEGQHGFPKLEKVKLEKDARGRVVTVTAWNGVASANAKQFEVDLRGSQIKLDEYVDLVNHCAEGSGDLEQSSPWHVERFEAASSGWILQDVRECFVLGPECVSLLLRHHLNPQTIGVGEEIARLERERAYYRRHGKHRQSKTGNGFSASTPLLIDIEDDDSALDGKVEKDEGAYRGLKRQRRLSAPKGSRETATSRGTGGRLQ